MNTQDLSSRTKQFSLRTIRLCQELSQDAISRRLADQLLRSGTSVGANYRAACRARTPAEFAAKMGIVEEEADESIFWMELLVESGIVPAGKLESLMQEADEILAMVVASIRTTKRNINR
jgi:four helix bundle protein